MAMQENKGSNNCDVSIIVPVYNVESYVENCLNSLLNQSKEEIEIILVDDGSKDQSGEICDAYALRDSRVRVIHQENKGVAEARNAGLDASTGKYIMFADADDWVEQEFVQIPFEIAENNNADLVIFRYVHDNGVFTPSMDDTTPISFSKDEALRYIYKNREGMIWNKLYRRTIVEEVRFIPGRFYEDGPFTTEVLDNAESIYYIERALYHYQRREGSTTHLAKRKITNDYFEMSTLTANNLEKMGYLEEAEWSRFEFTWIYLIRYGRKSPHGKECRQYLQGLNTIPDVLGGGGRLMFILLKISPALFDMMSVIFGKRMKIED